MKKLATLHRCETRRAAANKIAYRRWHANLLEKYDLIQCLFVGIEVEIFKSFVANRKESKVFDTKCYSKFALFVTNKKLFILSNRSDQRFAKPYRKYPN